MLVKKKSEPAELSEEEKLVQRVDAMMDPKQPEPELSAPDAGSANTAPPINIFENVGTAPEVSPDLLKKIGLSDKTEAPVKKLATLTDLPTVKAQTPSQPVILDDPKTDAAVDDITVHEKAAKQPATAPAAVKKANRAWQWLGVTIPILVLILFAVLYLQHKT